MLQRSLAQSEEDEEKLDAMGTQLRSQVKTFGTVRPTHIILGVRYDSKLVISRSPQRKDPVKARRESQVNRLSFSICIVEYPRGKPAQSEQA